MGTSGRGSVADAGKPFNADLIADRADRTIFPPWTGPEETTMAATHMRTLVLGSAFAALAASPWALADSPAPLALSGTYQVVSPSVGSSTVSMTFKATITNSGSEDVKGPIVLRHPNMIQKVWHRFGEQTIRAGKNVNVSAVVEVPRTEYDGWAAGGPSLFFYTQNDRGDIKTFRIPLSAVPAKAK
jgi:hypothetical protein